MGVAVHVRAAGHLRQRMPGGQAEMDLELAEGSSVLNLLTHLGLHKSQVWIVRINGEPASHEDRLAAGDSVELFPLVGGG